MKFIHEHKKKIYWGGISLLILLVLFIAFYTVKGVLNKDFFFEKLNFISKGRGYVTLVKGNTYYRSSLNSFSPWKQLVVGDSIRSYYQLRTREDSEIHVSFSGKTIIGIEQKSLLHIKEFTAKALRLELMRGTIFGDFKKLYKNQPVHIITPTAQAILIKNTAMKIQLSRNKNKKNKAVKPKETIFSILSGVIEVMGKSPKFVKKIYISSREKLTIGKANAQINAHWTKKEGAQLTSLIDHLRDSEEYLITTSIQFEPNSYEIDIDSFCEMNKVLKVLSDRESLAIKIKGHADSEGLEFYNDALSLKRATAIKQYFIEHGISKERFKIYGYGENQPVASNKTSKGRSLNRRVEFDISLE